MATITRKKIRSLVTEQLLKEYYRGFEKELLKHPFVEVFEFDNIETLLELLLGIPEFKEFLGPDVKKVSDIYNDSTNLATVEYVLDLMEKERLNRSDFEPPREEEEQAKWIEDIAAELEDDFEPADIAQDASEAAGEADELRLTKIPQPELRGALNKLSAAGLSPEKVQNLITKAIAKSIGFANQSGAAGEARFIADNIAPIATKIGDELAKILDGDLSNMRENKE
mgnify:CR=1 FL=1